MKQSLSLILAYTVTLAENQAPAIPISSFQVPTLAITWVHLAPLPFTWHGGMCFHLRQPDR
jgi:hypothetical protein